MIFLKKMFAGMKKGNIFAALFDLKKGKEDTKVL
jgi:hypothetical protein